MKKIVYGLVLSFGLCGINSLHCADSSEPQTVAPIQRCLSCAAKGICRENCDRCTHWFMQFDTIEEANMFNDQECAKAWLKQTKIAAVAFWFRNNHMQK